MCCMHAVMRRDEQKVVKKIKVQMSTDIRAEDDQREDGSRKIIVPTPSKLGKRVGR